MPLWEEIFSNQIIKPAQEEYHSSAEKSSDNDHNVNWNLTSLSPSSDASGIVLIFPAECGGEFPKLFGIGISWSCFPNHFSFFCHSDPAKGGRRI